MGDSGPCRGGCDDVAWRKGGEEGDKWKEEGGCKEGICWAWKTVGGGKVHDVVVYPLAPPIARHLANRC